MFIKLNQILSYCLRTIVTLSFISRQLSDIHIPQYAINKLKFLFGYTGHNWEQNIVVELDSSLNKWVDSVPNHCTCARIVIYRCIYSGLFCFQYDGIPLAKTKTFLTNRRLVTHFTIIFKFLSTVHSSRPPTNLHPFFPLLWLSAQTLRDRVAILVRLSYKEFVSRHYIPMSV